ncbi:HipA family kinase [Kushneria aurantia]|uniref:HipA family kinase n=1 Tax=Kushneria aurantia TaxID=504092 RepID=A0ABV6G245_9GAMM|nr:HipA family kinase [Kushneria aurantia]
MTFAKRLEPSGREDDLADGPAFASRLVPYSRELAFEQLAKVPAELQQRVLLFDIWTNNHDRFLTEKGGNVNLLLDQHDELVVIDHNLAFDDTPGDFARHVFSHQREKLKDLEVQARYQTLMETALEEWDDIIDLIPEEWRFVDPVEQTLPIIPDPDTLLYYLQRLREASFWSAP